MQVLKYNVLHHPTSPLGRSRRSVAVPSAAAAAPGRCCRAAAVSVRCQARLKRTKKQSSNRSGPSRGGRGFGGKPQEGWEAQLLPPYRVYYKQGYKPPRFQGTLKPEVFEDGSVGVVNEKEAFCAELLAISHPVAFLEGSLGVAPPVEDLHIALLESQLRPSTRQVLHMLPRRPLPPPRTRQPAAATATSSSSSSSGTESPEAPAAAAAAATGDPHHQQQQQQQQQQLSPQELYGGEVPEEMLQLLPSYWEQVHLGEGDVAPLGSKGLMRMLQASSWGEEFRDPATSQVRHERPNGFIGVWPEFALLRHSCAPNSSACVVDRFMLVHATEDIPADGEVTANKIGSVISAPLASRQAAHLELFGRPCRCRRCALEQQLPEEVAAELNNVADLAQGEWAARWQAALEGPSSGAMSEEAAAEALSDLQTEISESLLLLEDSLADSVPDKEARLMLTSAVYPAYDLAWQMEELLMEEPDLDKLASCVALLRMFARGSESHLYSALLLQQAYTARVQELDKQVATIDRKTGVKQRRLLAQVNKLLGGAQLADAVYAEAVPCRYGMIPDEGLLPQLEEGLSMFYAGLSALSTAQGEGLDEVPEVTRDLMVDGIPVTVTDTVEGIAFAGGAAAEAAATTSAAGPRLTIEVLDDQPAAAAAAAAAEGVDAAQQQLEQQQQEQQRHAEAVGS